jgi:drug/metabolite transporter (DMT)-like permease
MTQRATPQHARAATPLVWSALIAVYIVWGTTYLAIRIVNETLPPLIAAGIRFAVAGAVLYAWAVPRGDREGDRPRAIHWRSAALVGLGLIVGGNGSLVLAERTIPSGIASLIIALVPLWMALADRVLFGRRHGWVTVVGLVLGFTGAALLIDGVSGRTAPLSGLLVAVLASVCWTAGSLYSRTAELPSRPLVGAGMEMLVGGAALVAFGIARGELAQLQPAAFSVRSLIALVYLVAVGSWVGFTCYVWLLRNARTSLVSTYAYVNPVVAVFLGWLILDETIGLRTIVAGGIVVAGVALIISAGKEPATPDLTSGAEPLDERGDGVEREVLLDRVRRGEEPGLLQHGRGELEADG